MDREQVLDDLAAKEDIRQAMARYSRGIDRRDEVQVSSGRYLDRWERREGQFKIAHRQVIYDWWRTDANDTPWPGPDHEVPKMYHGGAALDTSTNVYGAPGPEDKSYELLTRLPSTVGGRS